MNKRLIAGVAFVFGVAGLYASATGCTLECDTESCADYGGSADKKFQTCADSVEITLLDTKDAEFFSCTPDYGNPRGITDANDCAGKTADAKFAYCAQ
ncbi:MAG: hypothetical protein U0414_30830 [Polyangiaceae bacterium]